MAPSVPHRGLLHPSAGDDRARGGATPGWRRGVLTAGVVIAVVSLAAWAVTLGLAAAGGTPPAWVGVVALYGLPVAFVLMGLAIVASAMDRRRR
ncbi:hypothetical protein RBS60_11845 [Sinomonas sp. ASV486]|uniref:hypothetical protein n=1 Tax=Sinomonas sp. ASV486 TaxID=3051170 RepID=UPI0027DDB760|nr:hypothetical protein [Sinomonas sp. ASV486]MDQ4490887.1 hypothetical protein [Sinomonas sp. ASV486]